MLTLYHGATSVCSQKARLGLVEKGLEYESRILDLRKGEQFDPAYMKLNPNAYVPTLVHDGKAVIESSVIIQYVDDIAPEPPMTPTDHHLKALVRVWLLRSLAIHSAANSLTYATIGRRWELAKPKEVREATTAQIPDPDRREKRRDLIERGVASSHVDEAIHVYATMFKDMNQQLAEYGGPWLMGKQYTLAEPGVLAYTHRLEQLGLTGFWTRYPRVAAWYERNKERPSFDKAITSLLDHAGAGAYRAAGEEAWPIIQRKLAA